MIAPHKDEIEKKLKVTGKPTKVKKKIERTVTGEKNLNPKTPLAKILREEDTPMQRLPTELTMVAKHPPREGEELANIGG